LPIEIPLGFFEFIEVVQGHQIGVDIIYDLHFDSSFLNSSQTGASKTQYVNF